MITPLFHADNDTDSLKFSLDSGPDGGSDRSHKRYGIDAAGFAHLNVRLPFLTFH